MREDDRLDLSVGLSDLLGLGATVARGDPLARIHAATEEAAEAARAAVAGAYALGETAAAPDLVLERIG